MNTARQVALSIITTCKGRLEHLKQTLPSMLAQADAEVIVVDYDCPEGTAGFLQANFPAVRVIKVKDRPFFNNWEARNIGASIAKAPILAFVDADTVLAGNFGEWATTNISSGNFGKMPSALELTIHRDKALGVGSNRLEGLLALSAETFRAVEGYDTFLQGWGAGGDTDMIERLVFHGKKKLNVPEDLVLHTIAHSDAARVKFHKMNISESHLIGLLYRTSKMSMMKVFGREISVADRGKLYALCTSSANRRKDNMASVDLIVMSYKMRGSNYKIEQRINTRVVWNE